MTETAPAPKTSAAPRGDALWQAAAALGVVATLVSSLLVPREEGWLGVAVSTAPPESGPAAVIGTIAHDSPAERAGLQSGDLVRRSGVQPMRRARDLIRAVRRRAPGAVLPLVVERGGTRVTIDTTLAARPPGYARLFEYERDEWQEPARVLDALGIDAGGAVVDLGAGGGYFTERLAERVGADGRVIAVDIDADALRALAFRFPPSRYPQVRVERGSAAAAGVEPASADAVLLVDAYHELVDPAAMLASLRTALRPGGRLVVVDRPATEWHPEEHAIPEARVREQVTAAGFVERTRFDLKRQFVLVFDRDREPAPSL